MIINVSLGTREVRDNINLQPEPSSTGEAIPTPPPVIRPLLAIPPKRAPVLLTSSQVVVPHNMWRRRRGHELPSLRSSSMTTRMTVRLADLLIHYFF